MYRGTGAQQSSQVCSFYLQGRCKYGNKCWNIHPQNQGGVSNVSSTGFNSVFNKQGADGNKTQEFTEFLKQVSGEMNQWEKSGQWLLSVVGALKGKPPLPGFTDTSPEELRVEAYESLKNNNQSAYESKVNDLMQRHKAMRDALKTSTQESREALWKIFSDDATQPAPQNLFGNKSQNSIFGGSAASPLSGTQAPSIFGGGQSKAVFGGQSNVFGGGTSTGGAFGGTSSGGNVFARPGNVFGSSTPTTAQNTSSLFGSSTQTQNSSNIFGSSTSTPTPASNVFGTSGSSVFGGGIKPSVFGSPATTQGSLFGSSTAAAASPAQGSVFGGNSSSSVFGAPSASQTQSPSTGLLGNAPQSQGLLGNAPPSQGLLGNAPPSQGLLGNAPPSQGLLGNAPPSQGLLGNAPPSQGLLGNAPPSQGLLGNAPPNQGLLGNAPPSQGLLRNAPSQSGGVFSNQQPQISGQQASPFSTPSSTGSIFGSQQQQQQQQQQAGSSGVFGNQTPTTSIFGKPVTAGQDQSQGTTSVFGSSNTGTPQGSSSLFGKPVAQPGAPTQPQSQPQAQGSGGAQGGACGGDAIYTPLNQLSEDDRKEFEAAVFSRLPLIPPPRELCV